MYYTQVNWSVINNTTNKVNRFPSNIEHEKQQFAKYYVLKVFKRNRILRLD